VEALHGEACSRTLWRASVPALPALRPLFRSASRAARRARTESARTDLARGRFGNKSNLFNAARALSNATRLCSDIKSVCSDSKFQCTNTKSARTNTKSACSDAARGRFNLA
jgi:hypothetical protein